MKVPIKPLLSSSTIVDCQRDFFKVTSGVEKRSGDSFMTSLTLNKQKQIRSQFEWFLFILFLRLE